MQTAYFDRFTVQMSLRDAIDASHPGPCDADVASLLREGAIADQLDSIPADTIASELREYGAWDADDLADTEENRARVVWIAAGNIAEDAKARHPRLMGRF